MARVPVVEQEPALRLVMNVGSVRLTDDQFFQLCRNNEELRIEMNGQGELIIMSPTKTKTGWRNAEVTRQLANWSKRDQRGLCFDSSTMFALPNGARRSPDASWISKQRWRTLSEEDRDSFSPICPDFVIELRSASDRIPDLKEKMEEYLSNGARLGWLLDPFENCAYIYRPNQAVEKLESPSRMDGDPLLPGFQFDFREILNPPE